jgi:hypothetical protein
MFPDEPSGGRCCTLGSHGHDGGKSVKYLAYMLVSIGAGKVWDRYLDQASWTEGLVRMTSTPPASFPTGGCQGLGRR